MMGILAISPSSLGEGFEGHRGGQSCLESLAKENDIDLRSYLEGYGKIGRLEEKKDSKF